MIYKKILTNKSLPLKKRILRVFSYFWLKRSTRIQWNLSFRNKFSVCPDYKAPLEKFIKKAHIDFWKGFQHRVNMATFRICTNISGEPAPTYIPEEVLA